MCYLSGGLLHQNKFPVKFIGPNLFFPWLLVFYYLTDAFVLVLFTSSASHPHPILVRRCSSKQVLLKISQVSQENTWVVKVFLQNISGGCFYPCYFSCFFFQLPLAVLPVLPYSTVTFFIWRNTFVFMFFTTIHD